MANNNANKNKKYFIVKNRSASRVIYSIPSLNIRREFAPGESMRIEYEELKKFMYEPGARSLIENFLQIEAEEVLKEFNINTQPEYFLDEKQIKELLLNGSLDAFLDCLDFAPVGVIDLIKTYAVALPLSDYNKRQALKDKLGFDVDKAITNKKQDEEDENAKKTQTNTSQADTTNSAPQRRTKVNYNRPKANN